MKLFVGQRLTSHVASSAPQDPIAAVKYRNAAVYVVESVVMETAWHGLYRGRQVFRNAKADGSGFDETDNAECPIVLIKTINYTELDNRAYVKMRRDDLWFETKRVLGCRRTNLLPEPLDYFEVQNPEDAFSFPRSGNMSGTEPVLVLENISGITLAQWFNTQKPSPRRRFAVLSEILRFVETMHSEKVLVTSLHPGSFWVDETDQIHYVATEAVVDSPRAKTFSLERFRYGFAAPEAYDGSAEIDFRADLYGWAALAYFLITSVSPASIAISQGTPFASFNSVNYQQLTESLSICSKRDIASVAAGLGLAGDRFARGFPGSLANVLLSCLEYDRELRPANTVVLRSWCENPPPPKVQAAAAFVVNGTAVRIAILTDTLDQNLRFVVRKTFGNSAIGPNDGKAVYEGRLVPEVHDRLDGGAVGFSGTRYCVFTVDMDSGSPVHSLGVNASLIDLTQNHEPLGTIESIARDVEVVGALYHQQPVPPLVDLIARQQFHSGTLPSMLGSSLPMVQRWAVSILQKELSNPSLKSKAIELLKNKALRSKNIEICLAAAQSLATRIPKPTISELAEISTVLGGDAVDDRIRMARAFGSGVLDRTTIDTLVLAIEGDRVKECPECKASLKVRAYDDHLRGTHGYIEVSSHLLPLGSGLKLLWQKLVSDFSTSACNLLSEVLVDRVKQRPIENLSSALMNQLRSKWYPHFGTLSLSDKATNLARLASCLRSNPTMVDACWILVSQDEECFRQLGRDVLIAGSPESLCNPAIQIEDYRRLVDRLCPREAIDTKIAVCRKSIQLGASAIAAERCIADLELDRETVCTQCTVKISKRLMPKHERLMHNLYVYKNTKYAWQDLVATLAVGITGDDPQFEATRLCSDILEERFGLTALGDKFAEAILLGLSANRNGGRALAPYDSLGRIFAQLKHIVILVKTMLLREDSSLFEIGMATFSCLHEAPARELSEFVIKQLDRCQSVTNATVRSRVLIALLQCHRNAKPRQIEALRAYIRPQPDKLAAIDRLQELIPVVGNLQAIVDLTAELEASVRLQCPICKEVMTGGEMQSHAQVAHQKVWEGRHLRSPVAVAEEYLDRYSTDPSPDLLLYAERLAVLANGKSLPTSFMRSALQRGIGTERYLPAILNELGGRNASLCRKCYLPLSSPDVAVTHAVSVDGNGDLSSHFAKVKQRRNALFITNNIYVSGNHCLNGHSTRSIHRNGALLLCGLVTGLVLLLLILLYLCGFSAAIGLVPYELGVGLLVAVAIWGLYRPSGESALSVAWRDLVPTLPDAPIIPGCYGFLAGLAQLSEASPDGNRELEVRSAASYCLRAFHSGDVGYATPAALYRLLIVDRLYYDKTGAKALEAVIELIVLWADRRVPSAFLDIVTGSGAFVSRVNPTQKRLLAWRTLYECFRIGMTIADLSQVLNTSAFLRTVLSPYAAPGNSKLVAQAFAFAQLIPANAVDGIQSSLQLSLTNDFRMFDGDIECSGRTRDGRIRVTSTGIYFGDILVTTPPSISLRQEKTFVQTGWTYQRKDGGPDMRYSNNPPVGYFKVTGHILTVNGREFRYANDPSELIRSITEWSEYFFSKVHPFSEKLINMSPTDVSKGLYPQAEVKCEACGTVQHFVKGKVATSCMSPAR